MYFLYIKAIHSKLDLPWSLRDMGHTVDIVEEFEFDISPSTPDAIACVDSYLSRNTYDLVISHLFFGEISDICLQHKLPYISWVYDSPLMNLYDDAARNPNNFIFLFDKSEYNHLKDLNLPHIYHMPLGTNTSRTGLLSITPDDLQKYSGEISFVGSLYEDNSYNKLINYMPPHTSLPVKTELMKKLCRWEEPKEWPYVSDDVLQFYLEKTEFTHKTCRNMDPKLYLGLLLITRKLSEMDRLTVLNALSEHHTVNLYTGSQSNYLGKNIIVHPVVQYYTDMNKVFSLSKINLNITLPSIESGLPQRVFDILGVGGFCLTNYQPEIDDLFTIGEDIEVFHNLDECIEKTDYYLSHDEERQRIAVNGYMKVCENYTYQHQLQKIIDIVTPLI